MLTARFINALRSAFAKYWRLDLRSNEDRLALLVGGFVLCAVVVRIFTTNLHYDAAYTYLHYAHRDLGFFLQIDIANNHPLNSLLVYVSAFVFPYNDFAIRLPALLSAIVYVLLSLNVAKVFRMRWFALAMLLGNYMVIEYLGYARGYVFAVTLVLAAIFVHLHRDRFKKPMWTMAYLLLFAVSAYIPSIIILFGMIGYDFVKGPRSFLRELWRNWFDCSIFLVTLAYFAYVAYRIATDPGKEVYGGAPEAFWDLFVGGFIVQLIPQLSGLSAFVIQLLISAFVIATTVLARKSLRDAWTGVVFIGILLIFFVRAELFDQLVPIERLLVPFWPIAAVAIAIILDRLMSVKRLSTVRAVLDSVLGVVIVLNLFLQVEWVPKHHFQKWLMEDYPTKTEVDSTNALVDYYLRKDQLHHIRLKLLMRETPDYTLERGDSIMLHVFREKRIVMTSVDPELTNVIFLHAYPRNMNDLPDNLIHAGFVNLDAEPYAMYRSDERLIKIHHIDDLDWEYLLIGQFNDKGRLWDEVMREI